MLMIEKTYNQMQHLTSKNRGRSEAVPIPVLQNIVIEFVYSRVASTTQGFTLSHTHTYYLYTSTGSCTKFKLGTESGN